MQLFCWLNNLFPQAQIELMEHTIKELEVEEQKMQEHDREVEQIISGFEQATQVHLSKMRVML